MAVLPYTQKTNRMCDNRHISTNALNTEAIHTQWWCQTNYITQAVHFTRGTSGLLRNSIGKHSLQHYTSRLSLIRQGQWPGGELYENESGLQGSATTVMLTKQHFTMDTMPFTTHKHTHNIIHVESFLTNIPNKGQYKSLPLLGQTFMAQNGLCYVTMNIFHLCTVDNC